MTFALAFGLLQLHPPLRTRLHACLDSLSPLVAVTCHGFPGGGVHRTGLPAVFAHVHVTKGWSAYRPNAVDKPSVQHVFGDSAVLHPVDVSEPSHAPLAEQSKHALAARSLQDVLVRGVILPCYAQDPSEATKMERVEAALLVGVRHPNLTAIQ